MQEACASMEQVDDGFAHHEPIILNPKSLSHGEDIEIVCLFLSMSGFLSQKFQFSNSMQLIPPVICGQVIAISLSENEVRVQWMCVF